jgi:hypothetical protein
MMEIHCVWRFLYGRAGHLTALFGGFRPGQSVRLGQDLHVAGDAALPAAPAWGDGAFALLQGGALSITYLSLTALLTTEAGALSLALADCTLPFTDPLVLYAGDATFVDVIFVLAGVVVPAGATVCMADARINFTHAVSAAFTVEGGAQLVLTASTLAVEGPPRAFTAVSVSENASLTVGGSQLVGADGGVDPFPCDATLPDCTGKHDGPVVVEGPLAIDMAAPLVCDVETGVCLSDLCFNVVDCGVGGTCVSPHGTCTCSKGYSGDNCETHKCRSTSCTCGAYAPGYTTFCCNDAGCAATSTCHSAGTGTWYGHSGSRAIPECMRWCNDQYPSWDNDCDPSC